MPDLNGLERSNQKIRNRFWSQFRANSGTLIHFIESENKVKSLFSRTFHIVFVKFSTLLGKISLFDHSQIRDKITPPRLEFSVVKACQSQTCHELQAFSTDEVIFDVAGACYRSLAGGDMAAFFLVGGWHGVSYYTSCVRLPSLKLTLTCSHLKMDGWKMKFPFGMAHFQGRLVLVSPIYWEDV